MRTTFDAHPKNKPGVAAFTLIELLVVIAIIAILAAIMLPVLRRSQETALAVACLNNTKELGLAVEAYCGENGDYFPQVIPWWTVGPYVNQYGHIDGGEWCLTGGVTPNTIGPLLSPYVKNNFAWVCPKRKRGLSYVVSGKTVSGYDPSVTGFISYGFNEIGVFGGPTQANGQMSNPQKFKSANCRHPSDIVSMCDVSGSNDPANINGDADACWLDDVWASYSGAGLPATLATPTTQDYNFRVQTAYAKHDNRLDFLFVDGHATETYPSKITWGQFWGVFDNTPLITYYGFTLHSGQSISKAAYDSIEWSSAME